MYKAAVYTLVNGVITHQTVNIKNVILRSMILYKCQCTAECQCIAFLIFAVDTSVKRSVDL